MRILLLIVLASFALLGPAHARSHHHSHPHHRSASHSHYQHPHHYVRHRVGRSSYAFVGQGVQASFGVRDRRPAAWCGWFMRKLLGVADPAYNLARNWAHWGHAGSPGIGAVVVWRHHVGKIVGREGGEWVIESGNDGHRVRTRPRSISGAIAFRWG